MSKKVYLRFLLAYCVVSVLVCGLVTDSKGHTTATEEQLGRLSGESDKRDRDQGSMHDVKNAEVMQKVRKLQIPFIANDGQADDQVRFYANTFGGTVFVTKDGEIVYSFSAGNNEAVKVEREKRRDGGMSNCAEQEPDRLIPQSEVQNPKSEMKGIVLREELVGGKVSGVKGEGSTVTKVNYFRGNDPSRWKTNIATYNMVNLGEVYKGIEVKLKAHGDTVEKLFYVKHGAEPEQIKLKLSGVKDCSVQNTKCEVKNPKLVVSEVELSKIRNPKLSVNRAGELVVKTAHGDVKFSRPVAYQEIDGKRVEVEVAYIAWCKSIATDN